MTKSMNVKSFERDGEIYLSMTSLCTFFSCELTHHLDKDENDPVIPYIKNLIYRLEKGEFTLKPSTGLEKIFKKFFFGG